MVSEENANQEVISQQEENTPSPGAMLKARREKLGLSQQDIADKLFLKSKQINDLENDVIDEKSSVTFTKGYVRNYAKQLGMNSHEVIEAFERYHNQTSVPSSEKLQSFSKRVAKQTHDDRWMMVTYVILLLIIAGVVMWWYQQPNDEAVSDVPLTEAVKREAANTPITSEGDASNRTQLNGSDLSSDPSSSTSTNNDLLNSNASSIDEPVIDEESDEFAQDGSINEGAISAPDTEINESNNLTALVSSNSQSEPNLDIASESDAAPISMVFTFVDDCWVNIKDASGEAIAYGVKQKGRVMEIQGVPPVEVTLGAPDNVRVSVNGETVDISSYQNGKTARFALPL